MRTKRYKYIRRFDNGHEGPVLANIDDSPSKNLLLDHGLADRALPEEELYDLVFDPNEAANIVSEQPEVAAELRARLQRWMHETGDPLLDGAVAPLPGSELNHPAQRSPADPTMIVR